MRTAANGYAGRSGDEMTRRLGTLLVLLKLKYLYTNIYVHVDIQYSHLDHINIASCHQHYQHALCFLKAKQAVYGKRQDDL